MLRTWVLVSYRTETFSKSHCAINISTPIDFKDWLKAIACDTPGKANDVCSGTKQTEFALEIFDLHPTSAPSRAPALNTEGLFLQPLLETAHWLLPVPPSFTIRKGKGSPQSSLTALNVSAKRAREKDTSFPTEAHLVALKKQMG